MGGDVIPYEPFRDKRAYVYIIGKPGDHSETLYVSDEPMSQERVRAYAHRLVRVQTGVKHPEETLESTIKRIRAEKSLRPTKYF